jgi:hypothetical protein
MKKIDYRFTKNYFVVKSPQWIEGYYKTTKEAEEFILRQSQYKNVNGWKIEQAQKKGITPQNK